MSPSLGNIRNTERLSFDKQQRYKIMVTAFDCGQKKATESVVVHIDVKPVCKPGWLGQYYSENCEATRLPPSTDPELVAIFLLIALFVFRLSWYISTHSEFHCICPMLTAHLQFPTTLKPDTTTLFFHGHYWLLPAMTQHTSMNRDFYWKCSFCTS